jgi:hypothetical protein
MKLLMYVSNDLIDSITLERKKIIYPGYIRNIIRTLKEKHDRLIRQANDEPEFIVHHMPGSPQSNIKPADIFK